MPQSPIDSQHRAATFAGILFNGVWRIALPTGDFLSVEHGEVDGDGEASRWSTKAYAALKHRFRFHPIRAVPEEGRWYVRAEPVAFAGAGNPDASVPAPSPDRSLAFVLSFDGCSTFYLEGIGEDFPVAEVASAASIGRHAVHTLRNAGLGPLTVCVEHGHFLELSSSVNFPQFQGDALRAFQYIEAALKYDLRSKLLNLADLDNLKRPSDIPQSAWDEVISQLRTEVGYRRLVEGYIDRVREFVQNVFIANAGLVDNVRDIIDMDGNTSVTIFLSRALEAMVSAVSNLKFTGSGAVTGALKIFVQQLTSDKRPNPIDFTLAVGAARDRMAKIFNDMITITQEYQRDVFADWGRLKTTAEAIRSGHLAWPDVDDILRRECARQLEIALYKDLLKFRWSRLRHPWNSSMWAESLSWKTERESLNKVYWYSYVPENRKLAGRGEVPGYSFKEYLLGTGSSWMDERQAHEHLGEKLFDELKLNREDVFNQWGLTEVPILGSH